MQLQGFPIDSHTFAWVRRMIIIIIWGHCSHGFVYLAVLYYTGWCSQPYSYYLLVRENMYITDHHWSQNQSFSDVIISDASTFQAFVNFTMHLPAVTPGAYIIEIIMQCCRYTRSVCVTWVKWVIPVSSQNRYYNSYYIHGHIVWSVFLLRIWEHNYSHYKKYW